MQTTDTTQFLAPDLVKDDWNFLEVWVDSMQSPPYILLLLGDKMEGCYIFDPSERYSLVKAFRTMKKLNSGYWKMNTSHWKDAYLALKFARAIETCCMERFYVR